MYLLINGEQLNALKNINDAHSSSKINPIKSNNGNMIVYSDLLTDCENPGDTWYDWKEWLQSLQPTNDIPAPKPPRPAPKPKNS